MTRPKISPNVCAGRIENHLSLYKVVLHRTNTPTGTNALCPPLCKTCVIPEGGRHIRTVHSAAQTHAARKPILPAVQINDGQWWW